ncbi:MAG: hypothetical protein A3H59_02655 [Candidatus Jacksonbacteria bacterium RIFCSPLOWO2_02_FULL_43_9]|nr:MAG: hypothetical protein UV70_C0011G0022 [Parcubacteria group bacterium GW2011_GWA2_43_13]OGY69328.1 MAG: hypothetical protein A3B94_03075 [Candidatus Jacksonbacteria bacterium RIFCSPHIGHO2_02_FULL_43_10]OGY71215.1 MAG: hypothetical protein A2986_00105 [Candidatus Jacksonbacteria bacterium RIFCSPLOWO2_01_FULL_44_13]OGY71915.1 MAG: hypothetical protein A3H59_02655 [Candidatus Jacksonbacteria bacterium RIFCSPLOWO2_02_FULL_43_9]HAZ16806.1 hypothetical protein [Candidatus Jacksonbacteria bacter
MARKLFHGFTLIELLVVISIISLLSAIGVASLNSTRKKARYTAVAAELKQFETALNLLSDDRGGCWPREGATTCGGYVENNPTITTLIADGSFGLKQYVSAPPSWPFDSNVWKYDNDGDTAPTPCASFGTSGVNAFIESTDIEHYKQLNTLLDGDTDPTTDTARACGKIKFSTTTTPGMILYTISATAN